jgi:hypothetical protein
MPQIVIITLMQTHTVQPISSNFEVAMVIVSKITVKEHDIHTPTHGPLKEI